MRQSRYASVKYIDDKVASLDFGSCFAYEHTHGIEAIKNLFGLDEKYGGLSIANMKVLSSAEKSDGITDTSKTSLF